jgi:hypothetical protein
MEVEVMEKPRCSAKTVVKGGIIYCECSEKHDGMHIGTLRSEWPGIQWWDNDDDYHEDAQLSMDAIGGP